MVGMLVGGVGEAVECSFRIGVMGTYVSVKKVGGSLVGFHSVPDLTGRGGRRGIKSDRISQDVTARWKYRQYPRRR